MVKALSRRRQYSDSTQRRLVRVARELFTEHGYAGTSLDAIVAGADVTKGALYHHFDGKQALFEAVFAKIERSAGKTIRRAHKRKRDPWEKAAAGLRAFLEVVQTEEYRRVIMQDGPGVLGYARFREREERTTHEILGEIVREVLGEHGDDIDADIVATLTHIFHGALAAAGSYVSDSDDPQAASERVETVIGFLLLGIRSQLESGALAVVGAADESTPPEVPPGSTDEGAETAAPVETAEGRSGRRGRGRGRSRRREPDESADPPDDPLDDDLVDPDEADDDLEEFDLTAEPTEPEKAEAPVAADGRPTLRA